jgi:hypothetical protein
MALQAASAKGHLEIVQLLLESGADPDKIGKPLHIIGNMEILTCNRG